MAREPPVCACGETHTGALGVRAGLRLECQLSPVCRCEIGRFSFLSAAAAMNAPRPHFLRSAVSALCLASLAALSACRGSVCLGTDGCVDDGDVQTISLSGTAATGRALASATVRFDCAAGGASTVSDIGGNYRLMVDAVLPCVITATAGGTTLHSVAFAGGTFNVTPETDLMLVYLASQLGTDTAHLVADLSTNGRYQQVLANAGDVVAAQTAVVSNLQQRYNVALTAPSFLTTPFTVGQAGVDSDLEALASAGAIGADGMPDPAAVSLLSQAGAANRL